MNTLIVSDVFGKTPALMTLSEQLNVPTIVDPYNGNNMGFRDESEAYTHFIEHVGLDVYTNKLLKVIAENSSPLSLIGFSVGAAAIWRLSEKLTASTVKHAICFYGSQIRNFTDINPQFAIDLVFPKSEPHFDVLTLEAMLTYKPNVSTHRVEYLHGFMNQCSTNYNEAGYRAFVDALSLKQVLKFDITQ